MSTSPALRPVTSRCVFCGDASAVARIFMAGGRSRYRTWRYVDYLKPVSREIRCLSCGNSSDMKTVIFKKPKDKPEIRQEIVTGIKRLKARGWKLFEGDPKWTT